MKECHIPKQNKNNRKNIYIYLKNKLIAKTVVSISLLVFYMGFEECVTLSLSVYCRFFFVVVVVYLLFSVQ